MKAYLSLLCGVVFWAVYYRLAIAPWYPAMWAGTAPPFFIFGAASFVYKALHSFWPSVNDTSFLSARNDNASDTATEAQLITLNRIAGGILAVCAVYIVFQMTVGKLMEGNIDRFSKQLANASGQSGTIETRSGEICNMLTNSGSANALARAFYPFAAQHADILRQSYVFEVMPDQSDSTKCKGRGHTNILTAHPQP